MRTVCDQRGRVESKSGEISDNFNCQITEILALQNKIKLVKPLARHCKKRQNIYIFILNVFLYALKLERNHEILDL